MKRCFLPMILSIRQKLILLTILFIINSCGENIREEIVERYNDGSKELVVKYKGIGNNEKVIGRTEYYKSGQVRKIESITGETKYVNEFYEDGDTNKTSEYLSGKLISMRSYYGSGTLKELKKLEGAVINRYDVDGKIFYDGNLYFLTKKTLSYFNNASNRFLILNYPGHFDQENKLIVYDSYFMPTLNSWRPDFKYNINDFHNNNRTKIILTELLKLDDHYYLNQDFNSYFSNIKYYSVDQSSGFKREITITQEHLNNFIYDCYEEYIEKW
jgi:hypothetical protein